MTPDVNVILLDMGDTSTREVITENDDGSYTVFINARLSHNLQLESYQHAMRHIESEDFEKSDVQVIEHYAHQAQTQSITPVPAKQYKLKIDKELKRIRAERKKLQKEIEENDQRVEFLIRCGVDFFAAAEREFLYGNDL